MIPSKDRENMVILDSNYQRISSNPKPDIENVTPMGRIRVNTTQILCTEGKYSALIFGIVAGIFIGSVIMYYFLK
jgi:hypothetical protein